MVREELLGTVAKASLPRIVTIASDDAKEPAAPGKLQVDFQNACFKLREEKAEVHAGRVFFENRLELCIAGQLGSVTAVMMKLWSADCQCLLIYIFINLPSASYLETLLPFTVTSYIWGKIYF